MLTLRGVADDPSALAHHLAVKDAADLVFRPLVHADADGLAGFLAALSPETRRLSAFPGYDLAAAQELCDAIARYDKLRLVLEEAPSGRIVGLFEFSLDLHPADVERYRAAGVRLAATDCRFGATLADAYQGRGLGTRVFPLVADVARRFGKKRMILWGGVVTDNARAIRYYEKHGFHLTGSFTGADGVRSLDMILNLDTRPGADAGRMK